MKRFIAILTSAVLVLTILAGMSACGQKDDNTQGKQTLVVSINGEPLHLDESLTMDYVTNWAITPVNDYLVRFDNELNILPSLAEKLDKVDDQTFEFAIREGVKFHNGREVKAQDVKFSVERAASKESGSELIVYFDCIDNVEVTGDYTGLIHLKKAYAPLLSKLTKVPIIPRECADTNKTNPVGCGPYKFVEWKQGQSIELEAFEDYWKEGYPKTDAISVRLYTEYNSERSAFLAGETDILMWINNVEVDMFEKTQGVYLHNQRLRDAFFVMCNCDVEPFGDARVRKAVSLALDKQALLNVGQQGYGEIIDTAVYSDSYYYNDSFAYNQDIKEAKRLLAEAGYPDGFDCELSIPITPVEGIMGELIANQLQAIGINAQPKKMDVAVFLDTVYNKCDFDIFVCGDSGDGDPDTWLSRFCKTNSGSNFGSYSNARLDELIAQGSSTYDEAQRKAVYDEALGIISEEQPLTFLFGGSLISALHDNVQGFSGAPTWKYYLDGVYFAD